MRSNVRNLVIVGAVVVVLGGAVAALKMTGNDKSSSSSSSSTASMELVSKTSQDVVSMKVTNAKGSYTLLPVKSESVGSSASKTSSSGSASSAASSVTWTVKELDGCPIDTTETGNAVQDGFSLVASKDLGTVSSLDDFGLTKPQATVEVRFRDGSSFDYKIGNVSATDSSAYYMCGVKNSNVYIVTIDQGLLEGPDYFISKNVLSLSDTQSQANLTALRLSGTNYPTPVAISSNGTGVQITSPASYGTDSDKMSKIASELTSVTASSVVAVNPDAAALKKYGFDKPAAVAEFTVDKGSYKLTVGAENGSSRYLMLGGTNVVYSVPSASVADWADAGLFGLRSKEILLPQVTTVKSMTVQVGNTKNELNLTRTKDAKKSTKSDTVYDYKVTGNGGKALDYENNFTKFYADVIGIEILSDATSVPSGTPAVTVQYRYFDKNSADTIAFLPSGDRRYTAVLNGKPYGVVTQNDIDTITKNIALLESGKTLS